MAKSDVFRELDERMTLPPGTLGRIYYDRKLRFVDEDILDGLKSIVLGTEYDPCLTFEIGARIQHHLYGVGEVLRKVHKSKIMVRFASGEEILLCEGLPGDPFYSKLVQDRETRFVFRQDGEVAGA